MTGSAVMNSGDARAELARRRLPYKAFNFIVDSVQSGHVEEVRLYLAAGMSVDAAHDNGWTALHEAAHSVQLEMVQFLLARGAAVDARTDKGWTPLHGAVDIGADLDLIRCLVDHGADVGATTRYGGWTWTAYQRAVRHGPFYGAVADYLASVGGA